MDVEVRIKEDMRALGCKSEMKITLAYHLYIYLVDKKLMYDSEYCYNKDVDTLYIVARPNKNAKMNIYVPIPTSVDVSLDIISHLQRNLCTVETGPTINLAFIEGDFTMVIYAFTKGLINRPEPEELSKLKMRDAKRSFINSELRKKSKEIVNDAMNGGIVEDDECLVLD